MKVLQDQLSAAPKQQQMERSVPRTEHLQCVLRTEDHYLYLFIYINVLITYPPYLF